MEKNKFEEFFSSKIFAERILNGKSLRSMTLYNVNAILCVFWESRVVGVDLEKNPLYIVRLRFYRQQPKATNIKTRATSTYDNYKSHNVSLKDLFYLFAHLTSFGFNHNECLIASHAVKLDSCSSLKKHFI